MSGKDLAQNMFLCSTEMLATIPRSINSCTVATAQITGILKLLPTCIHGYGGQERNFSELCFTDIYQVNDVCGPGGELPHSLPLPVLVRIDVEVNGAVEVGQQVTEAGHVRQPHWPDQLGLKLEKKTTLTFL